MPWIQAGGRIVQHPEKPRLAGRTLADPDFRVVDESGRRLNRAECLVQHPGRILEVHREPRVCRIILPGARIRGDAVERKIERPETRDQLLAARSVGKHDRAPGFRVLEAGGQTRVQLHSLVHDENDLVVAQERRVGGGIFLEEERGGVVSVEARLVSVE